MEMESGPLSKRKRLDNCLICNKKTSVILNGKQFKELLVRHLIQSSAGSAKSLIEIEPRIFNFCIPCNNAVAYLSLLQEKLDAILKKINNTLELIKFTMIKEEASGDTHADYFRSLVLQDLRPIVRMDRNNTLFKKKTDEVEFSTKQIVSSIDRLTVEGKPAFVTNTESKIDLKIELFIMYPNFFLAHFMPKVRMDLNNILIHKTVKAAETVSDITLLSNKEDSDNAIMDKKYVTVDDVLDSILKEGDSSNESDKDSTSQQIIASTNSDPVTVTEKESAAILTPSSPDNDTALSEVVKVEAEAKEYPFLEEIEQFDPRDEDLFPTEEICDPLDVHVEEETAPAQFEQVNTSIKAEIEETPAGIAVVRVSDHVNELGRPWLKPVLTYNHMIVLAIKTSTNKELLASEIFDFISENFPYYRIKSSHWTDLVRKCLNTTVCFTKRLAAKENVEISSEEQENPEVLWSINENHCTFSIIISDIAEACESSKDRIAYPERLGSFVDAVYERSVLENEEMLNSDAAYLLEDTIKPKTEVEDFILESLNNSRMQENVEPAVLKRENINGYAHCRTTPQVINSFSCQPQEKNVLKNVMRKLPIRAVTPISQIDSIPNANVLPTNFYTRPTFSPSQLAFLALANNADNKLGTRQIIEFITENFPYFRKENSWKKCLYETLIQTGCYFKRHVELGKGGPLVSWSINEVDPHYSQIRLQILKSLKESLSVNYAAAVNNAKLEEIIQRALGEKYDFSFFKCTPPTTQSEAENQLNLKVG